jgi:glucose uptake protein GlcU
MKNEIQMHNNIFRDTVLGVLLVIAAIAMLVLNNAVAGTLHSLFLSLSVAMNVTGGLFLLKAFKKDKIRLQTP